MTHDDDDGSISLPMRSNLLHMTCADLIDEHAQLASVLVKLDSMRAEALQWMDAIVTEQGRRADNQRADDEALVILARRECPHRHLGHELVRDQWDDGSGEVIDVKVICNACGVHFRNAREARAAGVFDRVDALRRTVIDATRGQTVTAAG